MKLSDVFTKAGKPLQASNSCIKRFNGKGAVRS